MSQLRGGLLEGRVIALCGVEGHVVHTTLTGLGARVEFLRADEALQAEEEAVGDWARDRGPIDAIVFDAGPGFGAGGLSGLTVAMEQAWAAVREVAVGGLIPAEQPGKIVLVGPRPDAGPAAEAVRAGLESLARTLAVEWARYELTAVMIAPGSATGQEAVAELICFLCSPGGAYLSGCRLELGAVAR